MPARFTNNAVTLLVGTLLLTDLTMTVTAGHGARFPTLGAGQWAMLTIQNGTQFEIVKATARAGDVFTIQRAQEGTAAQMWTAGSSVTLRVTAVSLNSFLQTGEAGSLASLTVAGNAAVGGTLGCTGNLAVDGSALFGGIVTATSFAVPAVGGYFYNSPTNTVFSYWDGDEIVFSSAMRGGAGLTLASGINAGGVVVGAGLSSTAGIAAATDIAATLALSAGTSVYAGTTITAVGNITGANIIASGDMSADNLYLPANGAVYFEASNVVYTKWDGDHIVFNWRTYTLGTATATSFIPVSDERMKQDIRLYVPEESVVDRVPVSRFARKATPEIEEIGFIAQHVQAAEPLAVRETSSDGTLGLDLTALVAILWEELRATRTLLRATEARVALIEQKE